MALAKTSIPGMDRLVRRLDEAVRQPSVADITESLKHHLCQLVQEGDLDLPEEFCAPCENHYARRLLYRSEDLGYVVVAMIWGPHQGTLLHDHAGSWCVEGVYQGQIEVTQYELLEHDGQRYRFQRQETVRTGVATAGSLIPPFEHHTICNANGDSTAVTLHVYGREMDRCSVFQPVEESSSESHWYTRQTRPLSYDN